MRRLLVEIGFIFGFIETFVVSSLPILFVEVHPVDPTSISSLTTGTQAAAVLIDPLVVLFVMFFVGRRIDLAGAPSTSLLSTLLGALAGTALAVVVTLTSSLVFGLSLISSDYLVPAAFYYGLGSLRLSLVAFAGMALAHFTRSRGPFEPAKAPSNQ
ncbi:MAG TPA: hypothetical protein VEB67_02310 [Nitrososphaerales archaeon]|nr:hypothetical protein [Nitrososphaerales archaeon]